MSELTRRDVLRYVPTAALAGGLALAIEVRPAAAVPGSMQEAIAEVVGKAKVSVGRVKLDLPPLSENGSTVPCTVSVESPMTAKDRVTAIHLFNEKNPQPNVMNIHLGPRAGTATVSTRIRLSDSQTVVAIARMSDGSFWSQSAYVIVTVGACLES